MLNAYDAYGTGRRKTSVARVFLKHGTGKITVNKKPLTHYFSQESLKDKLFMPLTISGNSERVDLFITVKGGGISGQAGAVQLGIARALLQWDNELKPTLKQNDLLTRDARKVERKKPGLRKARKRKQYSKR